MITKIIELKNFGVFEDFKYYEELKPFLKYNLFYGWNGSGKTTLSKLFRVIENQNNSPFVNGTFRIESDLGEISEILKTTLPSIKVFNNDFVKENTNLEKGKTNHLLYIGKDKDLILKKIQNLELKLNGFDGKSGEKSNFESEKVNYKKLIKIKEDFFKNTAADIKLASLTTIFTNPNIDKNKSESVWLRVSQNPNLNESTLSDKEYEYKYSFIQQGEKKEIISLNPQQISKEDFSKHYEDVTNLLIVNPINKSIERLIENTDISEWVQSGLLIHQFYQNQKCEFCNSVISPKRIHELSEHFNETFIIFQREIEEKISQLTSYLLPEITVEENLLFKELCEKWSDSINKIEFKREGINEIIQLWIERLEHKKVNPLNNSNPELPIYDINKIINYNFFIDILINLIKTQNQLQKDFNFKSLEYYEEIENHLVATKAENLNLTTTLKDIDKSHKKWNYLEREIELIEKEISENRKLLLDDKLAISEINEDLNKFLTSTNFCLEKNDSIEGGYLVKRNGEIAENLSEGEKTAIALCFFIAKLKEDENRIEDNIIVFDDPISSLDSNHLFSACSYITNRCENAKQIFFLTHNFWFFKLLRDWLKKKNKKNSIVSNFYSIKKGNISNADKSLSEFHSEYHFIFDSLFQLKNSELSLADSFSIANYCRRLLESFNSFKSQSTSGFSEIIQKVNGINNGLDKQQTDKVYYFLNKYSHLDRVESFENTIENIESEGVQIIEITFRIIELLDIDHYQSMMKICNKRD